jgi:hypothetical protein
MEQSRTRPRHGAAGRRHAGRGATQALQPEGGQLEAEGEELQEARGLAEFLGGAGSRRRALQR